METAELVVRRLRVNAAGPALAARVEDALRTSSKPVALLHRHVLVRRLKLRAPAGASAAAIARQLERAWREIEARARPIEQASDADDAVWAPSEAAARAALVARWVRGEDTRAWFWLRVAAPAGEGAWPQRALRLMWAPVGEGGARPGARLPPAFRPVLAVLVDSGALPRAVAGWTDDEVHRLLAVLEGGTPSDACLADAPRENAVAVSRTAPEALALGLLSARLVQRAAAGREPIAAASSGVAVPEAAAQRTSPPRGEAVATATVVASPAPSPRHAATAVAPHRPRAGAPPLSVAETPWAGLWLLLPILLREGLADDAAPLVAFADALEAAPGRFGIAPDDPVREAIAALDLPWQNLTSPWLRRAREAAVRDARLPLRRIALRRGGVHVSDTRIDVAFPAEAADVRIRRAGFDLDPGFVPWLGRIVRFHYA